VKRIQRIRLNLIRSELVQVNRSTWTQTSRWLIVTNSSDGFFNVWSIDCMTVGPAKPIKIVTDKQMRKSIHKHALSSIELNTVGTTVRFLLFRPWQEQCSFVCWSTNNLTIQSRMFNRHRFRSFRISPSLWLKHKPCSTCQTLTHVQSTLSYWFFAMNKITTRLWFSCDLELLFDV
jgi:hypothetical protein